MIVLFEASETLIRKGSSEFRTRVLAKKTVPFDSAKSAVLYLFFSEMKSVLAKIKIPHKIRVFIFV
jgi:hypothetical protein